MSAGVHPLQPLAGDNASGGTGSLVVVASDTQWGRCPGDWQSEVSVAHLPHLHSLSGVARASATLEKIWKLRQEFGVLPAETQMELGDRYHDMLAILFREQKRIAQAAEAEAKEKLQDQSHAQVQAEAANSHDEWDSVASKAAVVHRRDPVPPPWWAAHEARMKAFAGAEPLPLPRACKDEALELQGPILRRIDNALTRDTETLRAMMGAEKQAHEPSAPQQQGALLAARQQAAPALPVDMLRPNAWSLSDASGGRDTLWEAHAARGVGHVYSQEVAPVYASGGAAVAEHLRLAAAKRMAVRTSTTSTTPVAAKTRAHAEG